MLPGGFGDGLPFRRFGIDTAFQTELTEGVDTNSGAGQFRSCLSRGSIGDAMHLGMNLGRQALANIFTGRFALDRRVGVPVGTVTGPIAALTTARLPAI